MSCRMRARSSAFTAASASLQSAITMPMHRAAVALAPLPPDGDWLLMLIRFALRMSMALFAFGTARRVLGDPRP